MFPDAFRRARFPLGLRFPLGADWSLVYLV